MVVFAGCGVFLVCLGLAGVLFQEEYIKKILALNLFSSGIFLLLITLGGGGDDPVANAMVLTGIVVALGATALALALVRALHVQENT
ncbi:NADH-quinone oxidoreductase subunit K [Sulfurospirillum sp. T05]|uniref:NADH-quinone oxidoreductase subunit K n=1 Tax=Sulfurospirillum tamanense TaxID=2813362 RepID=A0ABS2WRN3_9BACT|nr:NADH-quinone oxidoreductase subunit K [Sulfurospirillum tamanensis]